MSNALEVRGSTISTARMQTVRNIGGIRAWSQGTFPESLAPVGAAETSRLPENPPQNDPSPLTQQCEVSDRRDRGIPKQGWKRTIARDLGAYRLSVGRVLLILAVCYLAGSAIAATPAYAGSGSSGNTLYLSPAGSDSNPGTIDEPFQTLSHAVSKLRKGDTLYLREGRYFEHDLKLSLNGTEGAPITLSSFPGERAVIDPGTPSFQNPPTDAWELVDPGIHLYRSKTPVSKGEYPGAWLIDHDIQLPSYQEFDWLTTTKYDFPENYIGPGIHHADDGHVFIRLEQNPNDTTDRWGKPVSPPFSTLDPNKLNINILGARNTLYFHRSSYVIIEHLEIGPAKYSIELDDTNHHITIRDSKILLRSYGVYSRGARNLTIANNEVRMGFPDWVYWGDVKGAWKPAYFSGWNSFSLAGDFPFGVITKNTVINAFDGITANGPNLEISYNTIIRSRDDAISIPANAVNMQVFQNKIEQCFEGISVNGSKEGPFGNENVLIHDNRIDVSGYHRAKRPGAGGSFKGHVWHQGITFGTHDCKTGNCKTLRWKVFNNTIIAPVENRRSFGYEPHLFRDNTYLTP